MLQFINTFLSLIAFLVFPCLSCFGIIFSSSKSNSDKLVEVFVRIISFFGFIVSWFCTYFIYIMNYKSDFHFDVPYVYDSLVLVFLPIFILAIAVLYTYISKRSEKVASFKRQAFLMLCLLVADLQFLALVQIQPILLTSVQQQDNTTIYTLTWINLLPLFIVNLTVFTTIAVSVIRKLMSQKAPNLI